MDTDVSTDAPVGSGHAGPWLAAAAVLLAVVLGVLASWAGHGRAEFTDGSVAEVEATFGAAGLTVCSAAAVRGPLPAGALAGGTYELGPTCADDTATVVVHRFGSAGARDAAAQRFESLVRPRGSGVVYTLGDTTVFLQGTGDHDVQERLDPALRAAGAR